jgi:hypothetical protein
MAITVVCPTMQKYFGNIQEFVSLFYINYNLVI